MTKSFQSHIRDHGHCVFTGVTISAQCMLQGWWWLRARAWLCSYHPWVACAISLMYPMGSARLQWVNITDSIFAVLLSVSYLKARLYQCVRVCCILFLHYCQSIYAPSFFRFFSSVWQNGSGHGNRAEEERCGFCKPLARGSSDWVSQSVYISRWGASRLWSQSKQFLFVPNIN